MAELQPEEIKDLLKELKEEYGGEQASRHEAQDDALQYLEEAYAAEARDEFESALAKCDMAIQLNPGLAEAHNLRGIVLEELGRTQEAVAAYREAARREVAESSAAAKLAPSELILLHGDKFARTRPAGKHWGWESVRLVHIDARADARELGEIMLATAFLAVEQAGAVQLEVRRQQALFGLLNRDKLYVVPGEQAITWPRHSFESQLRPIAANLQSPSGKGHNHIPEIIYDWWMRRRGRESPSPWRVLQYLVFDGLVSRGLLQKERKSGLKGFLAGTSYVLPAETAALATQQSLEPIRQLLATCRRTRPEVWDLLIEGIKKGLGWCEEPTDWD